MTRKVLLKYSGGRVNEPILATAIKKTGLIPNILYAEFGARGGEILISIDAPDREVNRLIEFFERSGVQVKEIKRAIQLDRDSCFDCGACLSICPSGALHETRDKSVELDEDRCVYCELCVPVCPVRALKLSKF
jgi:NAD-dependent dihydropyrimidine dehydrogenase PreA subunit